MNTVQAAFQAGLGRHTSARLVFDVETSPLPAAHLEAITPEFKAPAGWKDPAKIAASIAEKREAFFSEAALNATTGCILAIGCFVNEDYHVWHGHDESAVINGLWNTIREHQSGDKAFELVGFNSSQFDLPFLFQRSIALELPRPLGLRNGRYWANHVIDLFEAWNFGRKDQKGSLDHICRALGLGKKSGSGATFAKDYAEDQAKALDYLKNDCLMAKRLAGRIL